MREIANSGSKKTCVIGEESDRRVTSPAEQSPNTACLVIVVNAQMDFVT